MVPAKSVSLGLPATGASGTVQGMAPLAEGRVKGSCGTPPAGGWRGADANGVACDGWDGGNAWEAGAAFVAALEGVVGLEGVGATPRVRNTRRLTTVRFPAWS